MSEQNVTLSKEKFDIGEVAICVGAFSGVPHECTIVALPAPHSSLFSYNGNIWKRPAGHYLIECSDGVWTCWPWQLRKKQPPRQDRKTVSWDECPWQPETLHA